MLYEANIYCLTISSTKVTDCGNPDGRCSPIIYTGKGDCASIIKRSLEKFPDTGRNNNGI